MRLLILFLFLFQNICFAQEFFFVYSKDTTIEIKQNIRLCEYIDEVWLKITKSYDGEEVIFIPTHVKLKANKNHYFSRNHLVIYEYDPKKDEIKIIEENDSVIGKEIDFKKKTIKDKKYKNNENDHYKSKNKNRDKKIKDKEKKKLKIKPIVNQIPKKEEKPKKSFFKKVFNVLKLGWIKR